MSKSFMTCYASMIDMMSSEKYKWITITYAMIGHAHPMRSRIYFAFALLARPFCVVKVFRMRKIKLQLRAQEKIA